MGVFEDHGLGKCSLNEAYDPDQLVCDACGKPGTKKGTRGCSDSCEGSKLVKPQRCELSRNDHLRGHCKAPWIPVQEGQDLWLFYEISKERDCGGSPIVRWKAQPH